MGLHSKVYWSNIGVLPLLLGDQLNRCYDIAS